MKKGILLWACGTVTCLLALASIVLVGEGPWAHSSSRIPSEVPIRYQNGQARFEGFQPRWNKIEEGRFVSVFGKGDKVYYTIDVFLQKQMKALFRKYQVPYGVFVAVEPKTGKVLAFVEYSSAEPRSSLLPLRATFPAASIFKLITASALLEEEKISPNTVISFRGSRLSPRTWTDDPKRDKERMSFVNALAKSNNVVFAKAALRWLDRDTLMQYAEAYRFNRSIPFVLPVQVSEAKIESSTKSLAYSAAGLGKVGLSPLHAALIAAAISNDGKMMTPRLIEKIVGPKGEVRFRSQPSPLGEAISEETAQTLREMMAATISKGTSRKAFRRRGAYRIPQDITVGGKTGSLSGKNPRGNYSWFIGMAPLEDPEIAVAALVINKPRWHIKSSYVARRGFYAYFKANSSKSFAHR